MNTHLTVLTRAAVEQWDEMRRVASSIRHGTVSASLLIRKLEHRLSHGSRRDGAQARRGDTGSDPRAYRSPGMGAHQLDGELSFRAAGRARSVPSASVTHARGGQQCLNVE